jgi:hypothetical protein
MKLLLVVFVSMFLPVLSSFQTGNDPEHVVKRMIESGFREGHDSKVIGPMGDAAAVVITKILAGRNLRSGQIDSVLWILESAFADPSLVQNAPDREPRTALLLLQYLDVSSHDPELKKRIATTRNHIEDRYAKAMRRMTAQ